MTFIRLKRLILAALMLAVLLLSGCKPDNKKRNGKTKEHEIFGVDLNVLNPIVLWTENTITGETAFSRDPSNISAVIKMIERLKMERTELPSGTKEGISFYMSTIYGNFNFGTSYGDRLWVDGEAYLLDKDYTSEMERLFNLIKSESDYVGIVDRGMIDKIRPQMTYLELFELFGITKETTVLSGGKSFLYQYNNYEFYINYEKETDFIAMNPDDLVKEIFYRHNLTFEPIVREKFDFSYEIVYEKVISSMIDEFQRHHRDTPIEQLVLDSSQWIGVNGERAEALKKVLSGNYGVEILDTTALNAYMKRELEFNDPKKEATLFINAGHYSHIAEKKVNVTMQVVYPVEHVKFDFDKNFVLYKKDGRWFDKD